MIIAITGHKYSGKSTVAKMLSEMLGLKVDSFARPLKEIVCSLSGCTMEQLEDYDFKENEVVPKHLWAFCANEKHNYRSLLQGMGDYLRSKNPNIFIDSILVGDTSNLIISDCRFPNEAKAIKTGGGIVIKIVRPDAKAEDSHQSENRIDEIDADYTLFNDTTLDILVLNVDSLVRLLRANNKI